MRLGSCIAACVGLLITCNTASAGGPADGDGPGRKSCTLETARDQASQEFKDGIFAFERKDWLEAEYKMLMALDFDCPREELNVVVPYGRWVYRYKPEVYLGLSLHRLGQCLKEGGKVCSITRDWKGSWEGYLKKKKLGKSGAEWKKAMVVDSGSQSRCEEAEAKLRRHTCYVEDGCCFPLRSSGTRFCPVIAWWHKLDDSSVEVALKETTEEECQEVTTPVEWFWIGKAATHSNAEICKQLGQELSYIDIACSDVKHGTP
jgi:hypothetical protein